MKVRQTGSDGQPENIMVLIRDLASIFARNPQKNFNYKQLSRSLGYADASGRDKIIAALNDMVTRGLIVEPERGRYRYKQKGSYVTGTLDLSRKDFATLLTTEIDGEIILPMSNLGTGLHGDLVKVHIYARRKNNIVEGEVVEVLKRERTTFVGNIEISRNFAFLAPETRNMPYDIFIPPTKLKGARNGQKVIVEITDWPAKSRNPSGRVTEVLGNAGEHQAEIHAIMAEFDLPFRFSEKTEAAANAIPEEITPEEIALRRDFRPVPTFTIDPFDAKDFDDALSFELLPDGIRRIGIHIADVSHYIPADSNLDKEALSRGTSVYLVDRVIPMLPERLSNFLCSLRPNEDKLSFSVVVDMDENAKILGQWIGKTIIRSKRRFSYEEAQMVIDTEQGDFVSEIIQLNQLAQILRKNRFAKGSISFERSEVKFNLDETGKPLGVFFKEYRESNELIEEFMLLANKLVAEFIGKAEAKKTSRTFVYRVHDQPNTEKLASFSQFIRRFGYQLKTGSTIETARSINRILDEAAGKPEQNIIQTLAIRSMAKAIYSTKNIGHYGLAFRHYTHFTSPIRRYPDLLVHRLLHFYLNGGNSVSVIKYEPMCEHSSAREQIATNAERASVKFKQVEFLSAQMGKVFEGVISGVTEWGIYVELVENLCEGMVPLRNMDDDFYVFDEENYRVIGRNSRKIYQLGDSVSVMVVRANLQKKQLDFRFTEDGEKD